MSLGRRRDMPARQQQSVLAWPTGCQLAKRSVTHPTGVFYTFSSGAVPHMIQRQCGRIVATVLQRVDSGGEGDVTARGRSAP
jgi:hypothetical protein